MVNSEVDNRDRTFVLKKDRLTFSLLFHDINVRNPACIPILLYFNGLHYNSDAQKTEIINDGPV